MNGRIERTPVSQNDIDIAISDLDPEMEALPFRAPGYGDPTPVTPAEVERLWRHERRGYLRDRVEHALCYAGAFAFCMWFWYEIIRQLSD